MFHGRVNPATEEPSLISFISRRPLIRAGPIGELDQQAAVELYAHAISHALGGDRQERRRLTKEVELAECYRSEREECDEYCDECEIGSALKVGGVPPEAYSAFMVSEWWDGSGPGRVRAERIPRAARIVSVAEHWATLTAKGSPQLSQDEALGDLDACAGSRYDPEVVRAAHLAVRGGGASSDDMTETRRDRPLR